MAAPHDGPIADPLLQPPHGLRGTSGAPMHAPLGNSARTLFVFVLLVAIGAVVWWLRQPDDLTDRVGGREWVITEVDGEQATNRAGLVSTFVLDGTGEIRAVRGCNVVSGRWEYESASSRLSIDWSSATDLACSDDWPETYTPAAGDVGFDGPVLRIESETGDLRAISLRDHEPATVDDLAGTWVSGESTFTIGRRGLFDIDLCRGSWTANEDGPGIVVSFPETHRADCDLAPMWVEELSLVPVLHDEVLYMWRNRTAFPLDHVIVRLDPAPG